MSELQAIPTRYRGTQFRSRLEARWAAFFDLVGWSWNYEPFDLLGYVPDFIVEHEVMECSYAGGTHAVDFLVAPTPGPLRRRRVRRLVEVKPEHEQVMLLRHGAKIDASGWTGPASIVGSALAVGESGAELGVSRYEHVLSERWWNNWGGPWVMVPRQCAVSSWVEAGNRVQWMGVAAEPEVEAEVEAVA